jgi:hypothetical protein
MINGTIKPLSIKRTHAICNSMNSISIVHKMQTHSDYYVDTINAFVIFTASVKIKLANRKRHY